LSTNGRVVAFQTLAASFDPEDVDGWDDVFVRDLDTGMTEWVSRTPDGSPSLAVDPAISGDGRWVAFTSAAMYDLEGRERRRVTCSCTIG
jgi:Tol biopolymer transport system component